ncbi:probable dolichyl pyrophosphate Glc1Man9GlcNAc2 alpha-1,3-glucosyltransferase isoform X2 [Ricinus communis]|uniref:probable dolichyl pyrophosphate Glc1Man9GlcNAc2 alpha-1,3-glucosyltransferase isoform X2 n=1 Tax=Ricinus communis TaxID=3988 RepID=UPI00201A7866|nr:probable dolichyl pyrophosphate Glc1Man9GlcNAc2 alpha-1,3-glucosyltransferase isoform X2 [Ricinus communis]
MECQTLQMHARSAIIQQLFWFFSLAACIKLVLIPSYHSTDFEVHRHWLALTHSLPLSQWYFDETSPWTLDYPPFFAYYEYILSLFAQFIDPQMVDIYRGLNYKSNTVIYFQRISVIISDLCLLYGIYRLTKNLESRKRILMWVLVVWSPGLIMVDHMHFQYNGFLLGLLMLSISYLQEGRDLMGGFFFSVLLCFKHLFAVAAPVYFVYLLRHYCWKGISMGFRRFSAMGAVVVVVFAVAYGPFLYYGQIQQVVRRMFPFGRGLCHAYWAPNFWVFYMVLDKCLAIVLRKLRFNIQAPTASFTGGLVGDSSPFAVLPQEYPIKVLLLLLHSILMWYCFSAQFTKDAAAKENAPAKRGGEQFGSQGTSSSTVEGGIHIGRIGKCYLVGLLAVETWGQLLHPYLLGDKLPFLPLILISTFCALEIMYSWIWQLRWILKST